MNFLILAGGSGTKLWPLSRKFFAKQFLTLFNEKSLLQNSVERIYKNNNSKNNLFIVTNEDSKFIVYDQMKEKLPDFDKNNVIVEPLSLGTLPAIIYGSLYFNEDDIITILSSDHFINDETNFFNTIKNAIEIADKDKIVIIGIKPDSPKNIYGYIFKGVSYDKKQAYIVEKFIEKPEIKMAEDFLKNSNCLWNAGIFVFRIKNFLKELKEYSLESYNIYLKLKELKEKKINIDKNIYSEFKNLSFDKVILEKSKNVIVIEENFKLRDMTSFQSLYEILPKDENNNAVKIDPANFVNIDCKNIFVYGSDRVIATIDLSNISIIDTKDALLVVNNNSFEKVEDVVKKLQNNNHYSAAFHKTVYRPWGSYTILDIGTNYQVKKLTVRPGMKISLQYHKHRSETWTVVNGVAEVTKDNEYLTLFPSQSVFIPAYSHHRLYNPLTKESLTIIEVQTGDYLGEDDIIRIEDDFHRK